MTKLVIIPIILALGLAACGEPQTRTVVQDKYVVVSPPESMYKCPQLKTLPDPAKLTDLEVARIVVRLDENNRVCGASMKALKNFYINARRRYSG